MNASSAQPKGPRASRCASFSLVELVMVVAIIAVLGAIAVPRLTQASQRAKANAIQSSLTNIRKAIDRYYAEHSRYPGYNPSNGNPDGNFFVEQLSLYTTVDGDPDPSPDSDHRFGPYISKPFPTNPTNGLNTVHVRAKEADAVPKRTTGWHACLEDGSFGVNATVTDMAELKIEALDVLDGLKLPK